MTVRDVLKDSDGWKQAAGTDDHPAAVNRTQPFKVAVHLKAGQSSRKRKRDGVVVKRDYDFQEAVQETEGDWSRHSARLGTFYEVDLSKEWHRLRKFRKCSLGKVMYSVGDIVYILKEGGPNDSGESEAGNEHLNAGVFPPTPGGTYVAKILEIRARDPHRAFLRVNWLYWPEDLEWSVWDGNKKAKGRQDYHGRNELIASNHMDIVNAVSIHRRADVRFLPGSNPLKGLYWRQGFDVNTDSLTYLPRICICNGPENPDYVVFECPSCKLSMHEGCVNKALADRVVAELNDDTSESSGTASVRSLSEVSETPEPEMSSGRRSSGRRRTPSRKVAAQLQEGKKDTLRERVEVTLVHEAMPPVWMVKDLKSGKQWVEGMQCLKCANELE